MANQDPASTVANLQGPGNMLGFDPQTLQALQASQVMQAVGDIGGNSAERANNAAVMQGIQNVFPSPAVQQAQAEQHAIQGATLTQNPNENDMDFTMRQLTAQRNAVARLNPEMAARLNTQLLALGQMKFENSRLTAADQRSGRELDIRQETADTQKGELGVRRGELGIAARRAEMERERQDQENQLFPGKLIEAQRKSALGSLMFSLRTARDGDPEGSQILGTHITGYDINNPDDTAAMMEAQKRGEVIKSQAELSTWFDKADPVSMRVAGELARISAEKGQVPDDNTLAWMAGSCAIQNSSAFCPRKGTPLQGAMAQMYQKKGISIDDIAAAQAEYRGAQIAVNANERRAGNMAQLERSVYGLGQNVLDIMDKGVTVTDNSGVARTYKLSVNDWRGLNYAMSIGRAEFSDPAQRALNVAMQGFVTDYARVIAGATGITSDQARKDAWEAIGKWDSPLAMKAGIDQARIKELGVIQGASDEAREVLVNGEKQWPHLIKILDKLGVRFGTTAQDAQDQASRMSLAQPTQTSAAAPGQPAPAAPQASAAGPPMAQPVAHQPTFMIDPATRRVVPYSAGGSAPQPPPAPTPVAPPIATPHTSVASQGAPPPPATYNAPPGPPPLPPIPAPAPFERLGGGTPEERQLDRQIGQNMDLERQQRVLQHMVEHYSLPMDRNKNIIDTGRILRASDEADRAGDSNTARLLYAVYEAKRALGPNASAKDILAFLPTSQRWANSNATSNQRIQEEKARVAAGVSQ